MCVFYVFEAHINRQRPLSAGQKTINTLFVVLRLAWPIQCAIVLKSTPARSRCIAVLCGCSRDSCPCVEHQIQQGKIASALGSGTIDPNQPCWKFFPFQMLKLTRLAPFERDAQQVLRLHQVFGTLRVMGAGFSFPSCAPGRGGRWAAAGLGAKILVSPPRHWHADSIRRAPLG